MPESRPTANAEPMLASVSAIDAYTPPCTIPIGCLRCVPTSIVHVSVPSSCASMPSCMCPRNVSSMGRIMEIDVMSRRYVPWMAAGPVRDDAELIAGLDRWLAGRGQRVVAIGRPASGWTNETVMVDVGDPAQTLVVRMPPRVASFPDADVAFEAAVMGELAGSSIAVPGVVAVERDAS